MPTSRPRASSSSEVTVSPISRSAVCSSAARWMIRSSAARSIPAAGGPSLMLVLGGALGRLQSHLRHERGDLRGRKRWAGRFPGTYGLGAGSGGLLSGCLLEKWAEQLDRDRKDRGRVVLGRDFGDGLQVTELECARLGGEGAGRLRQRL